MEDWINNWKHPKYKEFLKVWGRMTRELANEAIPYDDTITWLDKLEQKTYTIKMPKFGDAWHVYNAETDPFTKAKVMNYIRLCERQYKKEMIDQLDKQNNGSLSSRYDAMRTYRIPSASFAIGHVPVTYIVQLPEVNAAAASPSKPKVRKVMKKTGKDAVVVEDEKKEDPPKRRVVKKAPKPLIGENAVKVKPATKKKSTLSPKTKERLKKAGLESILSSSLQGKFPFKKHDECTSRKSSATYYISKKDLVDAIKESPTLIKKVGTKYASMTKEGICDKLFS